MSTRSLKKSHNPIFLLNEDIRLAGESTGSLGEHVSGSLPEGGFAGGVVGECVSAGLGVRSEEAVGRDGEGSMMIRLYDVLFVGEPGSL